MHKILPSSQPQKHANAVSNERSVGVAAFLEVNHNEKLRKEDHVNQIATHGPEISTSSGEFERSVTRKDSSP